MSGTSRPVDSLIALGDVEHRQQRHVETEELKPRRLRSGCAGFRVVDHARCGDRPARPLRTAAVARDRAWRVDGVVKVDTPLTRVPRVAAILPPLSSTTIRFSTVPSRSVSVSWTLSPMSLSPCGVSSTTLPIARTWPGLAVPDDLVRREVIALAVHPHFAARGHDVGIAVVDDLVGAERDRLVGRGRLYGPGRVGRRRPGRLRRQSSTDRRCRSEGEARSWPSRT